MRKSLTLILSLLVIVGVCAGLQRARSEAAISQPILDEQGRHLIVGGYVTLENIPFTADDYRRMVRMGANFQVIRMPMWMVGAWPGVEPDAKALAHFDELVRLGKAAGMKTVFKLVVYGGPPFGEKQWDMVWNNTDGAQEKILEGWTGIWNRYKDEPSVFGYDLLNEPARGRSKDYERIQTGQLLPLLRRLTDAMQKISPEKWALYQPLLRKPEDQITKPRDPVVPMEEPFGRARVIYAPHLYKVNLDVIKLMLDNFRRQAALSDAPLLLGEWGSPTFPTTDDSPEEQQTFTKAYQFTVQEMDQHGIGAIKAWFSGTSSFRKVEGVEKKVTWAIFSDDSPAGHVERKYITDVIVRPRPLVVAGRLVRYGNDFATRTFEMTLKTDPALGATEIFVPAERHYPKGFRVEIGDGLTLEHSGKRGSLRTARAVAADDREQARLIRWDDDRQRLTIDRWVGTAQSLAIKIKPLTAE